MMSRTSQQINAILKDIQDFVTRRYNVDVNQLLATSCKSRWNILSSGTCSFKGILMEIITAFQDLTPVIRLDVEHTELYRQFVKRFFNYIELFQKRGYSKQSEANLWTQLKQLHYEIVLFDKSLGPRESTEDVLKLQRQFGIETQDEDIDTIKNMTEDNACMTFDPDKDATIFEPCSFQSHLDNIINNIELVMKTTDSKNQNMVVKLYSRLYQKLAGLARAYKAHEMTETELYDEFVALNEDMTQIPIQMRAHITSTPQKTSRNSVASPKNTYTETLSFSDLAVHSVKWNQKANKLTTSEKPKVAIPVAKIRKAVISKHYNGVSHPSSVSIHSTTQRWVVMYMSPIGKSGLKKYKDAPDSFPSKQAAEKWLVSEKAQGRRKAGKVVSL